MKWTDTVVWCSRVVKGATEEHFWEKDVNVPASLEKFQD